MNPTDSSAAPATPQRRRRWPWVLAVVVLIPTTVWLGDQWWAGRQERSAQAALDDDKFDDARHHIALALKVRSNRFDTNLLAARIERSRRDYPAAEKYLIRCKEIGGMTEPLQMEWFLLRCERGEAASLSGQLLAAVAHNHPASPAILESLALVAMRDARYPDALKLLDQWVERVPDSPRALDWRGWVNNQMDMRGPAIDDYTKVLELRPHRSSVRLRLAQVLINAKRHPEAMPHLERLRAEDPANAEVLTGMAACMALQLKGAEARQLLDGVLSAHPDDYAALLLYGEIEHQEEHYPEAERWLRKALTVKPNEARARYALHLALQAQPDRQEEAAAERKRWECDRDSTLRLTNLLRGELASRPKDPDLAAEAGEMLLRLGEDQRGLYWLNAALKLNPQHVRSHRALLEYYERLHDTAHAEQHRQFVPKQ